MQDYIIDDYEWCMIGELDDVVRPVGPFISIMEAPERVTFSLVFPRTSGLLHATNKLVLVLRSMYKHGVRHEERMLEHDDLCIEKQQVRNVLHKENIIKLF